MHITGYCYGSEIWEAIRVEYVAHMMKTKNEFNTLGDAMKKGHLEDQERDGKIAL
jgi:hypothetical protein